MSIVVNGETLCLEGIITFVFKCVITHLRAYEISTFFRGLYPRTPVSRGASSNSAGKEAYNAGRGRGGRGERGGECYGATAPPPQFLNSVHAPA